MPKSLQFKQASHLEPALLDRASVSSAEQLLGRWLNTNRETQGIAECTVERDGQDLSIRIVGVGPSGPIEWPRAKAEVLANLEEEAGQRAVSLSANFDFGFMLSETYIRVNKGVLVIVEFNTFRDGSGRSNYVNREFFYRPD